MRARAKRSARGRGRACHQFAALLVILAACGARAARSTAPETHYVYRGERIQLRLDAARIAVRVRDGVAETKLRQTSLAAGVQVADLAPTGVPGWALLGLDPDLTDAASCAAGIAALATQPGVEFASPVFQAAGGGWMCVTPAILMQLRPGGAAKASALLAALRLQVARVDPGFGGLDGAYVLHSEARDGFTVLALANRLAHDPRVAWAEPDMQFSGRHCYVPNDPGFGYLWGIQNVGQSGGTPNMDVDGDLAWDTTTGSDTVKVLVLDVGVQRDHPDLNVAGGADFTGEAGGGGPVNACDNHGTAVAGCIAAVIDNGRGTVGIAPRCPVLSARIGISSLDCSGSWIGQASWTVNALAWGFVRGARVSNNSNGYGYFSNAIDAAYTSTRRGGMVHFAAAGNGGQEPLPFPAVLPAVNAVAAIQRSGELASFTNFGGEVDFCAPGVEIFTTDRTGTLGWGSGDYVFGTGTSFASPYAAGVAALVMAQNPARTPDLVEMLLRQGCKDLGEPGFDAVYSWGLVNAFNSLNIGQGTVAEAAAVGPRGLHLAANAPNPFTGSTTLRFTLASPGRADLGIYDLRGRLVRRVAAGDFAAGPHALQWDGRNDAGRALPAGVYFCRLRAQQETASRRLLLYR